MTNLDFTQFNLDGLYILDELYLSIIDQYNKKIKEDSQLSKEEKKYLELKTHIFIKELEKIKNEILNKPVGTMISREFIYDKTKSRNNPIIFTFKIDSEAYKQYGNCIVGFGIYTHEEEEELFKNIASIPQNNTYGIVKIEAVQNRKLNTDKEPNPNNLQITDLKNIGIDTKDILTIQ